MTTQWTKMKADDYRGVRQTQMMVYFTGTSINLSRPAKLWIKERSPRFDVFQNQSGDKVAFKPDDHGRYSADGSAFMKNSWRGHSGRLVLTEDNGMLVAILPTRSLRTNGTQE